MINTISLCYTQFSYHWNRENRINLFFWKLHTDIRIEPSTRVIELFLFSLLREVSRATSEKFIENFFVGIFIFPFWKNNYLSLCASRFVNFLQMKWSIIIIMNTYTIYRFWDEYRHQLINSRICKHRKMFVMNCICTVHWLFSWWAHQNWRPPSSAWSYK